MQWRYQKHNPPEVDFTWEDEVRLQSTNLDIKSCKLLVPSYSWEERLKNDYLNSVKDKFFNNWGETSSIIPDGLSFSILYYKE